MYTYVMGTATFSHTCRDYTVVTPLQQYTG